MISQAISSDFNFPGCGCRYSCVWIFASKGEGA
jgi:hypothetical protein